MTESSAGESAVRPPHEMTLMELWLIVWARKYIVAAIIGGSTLVGVTLAFTMPQQHRFATVIEIGNRILNEEIVPIETLSSVIAKLQDGYIPTATLKLRKDSATTIKDHAFNVSGSQQSQIVTVASVGESKDAPVHLALHARIAEALIQDHNRTTDVVRDNAAMMQAAAEENFANLEAEETAAEEQIGWLGAAIAEAQKRSNDVSQRIAQLNDQLSALKGLPDSSDATQAMLLSHQISALMALEANLSERAGLGLRVERSNIQARLAAIARKKETARHAIRYRETVQRNIQATRVVGGETIMSSRPVAPNKLILIFISLIVGVVTAVGLVLALDFFSKAHGRGRAIRS